MNKLPVRPPIWNKARVDQQVCIVIGARRRRFAFFNETGTGKTFLSIALQRYFKKARIAGCALILVPNKQNKWEWLEEGFQKHSPKSKAVVLNGSSEDKWAMIEENPDADAFIETYAGLMRMVCDMKKDKRKRSRGKKKNRLVPNREKVKRLCALFDQIYLDESTYVKNRSKLPWRICNKLSEAAKCFFILTATPFGKNLEDVWGQIFLVDRGYTLGENLTLFRAAFYDETINYWGGHDYKLRSKSKREVSEYLDNVSIAYPADETTMPHLTRIPRYATLGEDGESYYEKARRQIIEARGDKMEQKNAFMMMRQISSGFIGFKNEAGERARFELAENPKLELLEGLVDGFDPAHKFIIFHEFLYSGKVIAEMLKEKGIKFVTLNGNTKNGKEVRHAFRHDPWTQCILLSNSAGGYGLNLQNAKYGIYYESPVGAILRKQTEKRFDRQYSLHKKVVLFDLIVRGTADQSILNFHEEGRSLWKAILNDGPQVLEPERPRVIKPRREILRVA
jgi:SNF2 family DNA or RNA helicase